MCTGVHPPASRCFLRELLRRVRARPCAPKPCSPRASIDPGTAPGTALTEGKILFFILVVIVVVVIQLHV